MTMEITEVVGPANDEAPAGTVELDATTPLNLPTVYGIGAAFRANEGALTISLEWIGSVTPRSPKASTQTFSIRVRSIYPTETRSM